MTLKAEPTQAEIDTLREATAALHAEVARLTRELAEACEAAKERRDAHYLESVRADAAEAQLAEAREEVERIRNDALDAANKGDFEVFQSELVQDAERRAGAAQAEVERLTRERDDLPMWKETAIAELLRCDAIETAAELYPKPPNDILLPFEREATRRERAAFIAGWQECEAQLGRASGDSR